ncbi:MAG: UbiA family prenyltransferase [Candidatus Micrarchaeia archaeon]
MRFTTFATLTRIEHSVLLAAGTWLGAFLALGHAPATELAILSVLPPFCIGLAAFALNDFFDREADRLNKRFDRPLVNGSASPEQAIIIALLGFLFGLAFSVPLSFFAGDFTPFKIAFFFSLAAIAYSAALKSLPLLGNLFIAASMAIAMVFGNIAVTPSSLSPPALAASALAFIAGLGREIAKTVQDVEGDRRARKATTLPMLIGIRNSLIAAITLYWLAILLSFAPFFSIPPFTGNLTYLMLILACDVMLAFSSITLLQRPRARALERSRKLSLGALALGIMAFLFGAAFPIFLR